MTTPVNKVVYAVYGASGFGRGVMPLARAQLKSQLDAEMYDLVFIDDGERADIVNGHQVYDFDQFLALDASEKYVSIAIANSQIREKLINKLQQHQIGSWSIIAPTVIQMDDVQIGEGAVLCHHVHLTSNIRIGQFFHANYFSYVAHDCVIGDYVTFALRYSATAMYILATMPILGQGQSCVRVRQTDLLSLAKARLSEWVQWLPEMLLHTRLWWGILPEF